MIDFQNLPLALLAGLFALAAGAVWVAGTRVTRYAGAISDKTGIGKALAGMLLLGGITSLPEVAAVGTSAASGNAPLALNNLLGTASINVMLLAVADIVYGRDALTSVAARATTLIQGVLSMLLAAAVALAATVGDVALFAGIGAFATVLLAGSIAAIWISSDFEQRKAWIAVRDGARHKSPAEPRRDASERSLPALWTRLGAAGAVILVAGFLLSTAGSAIAERAGIAQGMVGFVLVGLATSLPEISTIAAALRVRRYEMAVGDVFGTNIFNIGLVFLADAFYRAEPILDLAGRFEAIGASLAVLVTGVFVVGLLERRDKAVLRMGYDSMAAVLTFAAGLFFLSQVRG